MTLTDDIVRDLITRSCGVCLCLSVVADAAALPVAVALVSCNRLGNTSTRTRTPALLCTFVASVQAIAIRPSAYPL